MSNLEERADIFVLKYMCPVSHEPTYGLFQYFKSSEDNEYHFRTPTNFSFPNSAKELGELVASNWVRIVEWTGTYILNFSKKGYFPDFFLGDPYPKFYEDLDSADIEEFMLGYITKKEEMKKD